MNKDYTVEENKKRQQDIQKEEYNEEKSILYVNIYKSNRLKDSKRLQFKDRERCMIHIENMIKTTDYNLHAFSDEKEGLTERYYITLKK